MRLDLDDPAIYDRELWSLDRPHPSERGHRWLALRVGELLNDEGLTFALPALTCTSPTPGRVEQARTLAVDITPWLGRRVRDLAPWAACRALRRIAPARTARARGAP